MDGRHSSYSPTQFGMRAQGMPAPAPGGMERPTHWQASLGPGQVSILLLGRSLALAT